MKELRSFNDPSFPFAWELTKNLRAEDKMELETASGLSAYEAVFSALAESIVSHEWWYGNEIHSVSGVVPDPNDHDQGCLWMVGTPVIERSRLATIKAARRYIRSLLESGYTVLWNYVDCRNELHIKWLKALDADFYDTIYIQGMPFIRFEIKRESYV